MEIDKSLLLGLISVIIAFISTIIAIFSTILAHRSERDRKYNIFYDNINSIYVFIHDAFSILSNEYFNGIAVLKEAEQALDLGVHKMKSYALINNLPNLDEFSLIYSQNEEESNKSFTNTLFILETKYYEFREKHMAGKVSSSDEVILTNFLELFQGFDDLTINYLNFFLSKRKCKKKREKYYKDLKSLREKILVF